MAISTAVDASAVARVVGIETKYKNLNTSSLFLLPQRVALIGQGSTTSTYSLDKNQITSANEVGTTYGFGSPVHLAALQLFPINGDGVGTIPVTVYPMSDDGSGVASAGDITPSGSATEAASYRVSVNNILSEAFVIDVAATVATVVSSMTTAINAVLAMPIIAVDNVTEVTFTSKWKGTSANDIVVSVEGSTTAGNVFAITQAAGGLVNPDVDGALDKIGSVWETMILNCLDLADTATLTKYETFGEGRWGALTKKPLVVFSGNTEPGVGNATTIPDARPADRTNCQLVAPGSVDLPFVVAARELSRIVVVANSKPASDYGSRDASGLTPGSDAQQWNYPERDEAIKKGSSSIIVKDGVINIADTVTFYHPSGDPVPAYRYVVDIVKLQNIIFNLDLIFNTAEWDGAPLIPDDQPTTNPDAKKPSMAVAAVASLVDKLANEAIIADPAFVKASIIAGINGTNPKRLDIAVTWKLSGNTNIISIDNNFGFNFGVTPFVA